jgi:2-oxoglutarate ferredoxin oxidoreductase subunit delta
MVSGWKAGTAWHALVSCSFWAGDLGIGIKWRGGGLILIEIDENLCKGCEICIEFCPLKVFEKSAKLNRKGYYVPVVAQEDECVGCRLCELLCPEFAIIVTNE